MHHHLGKLGALLWVESHDVPQQEHVVWSVVDLLSIQNDLLELPCLCKTLDHLHTHKASDYGACSYEMVLEGEEGSE